MTFEDKMKILSHLSHQVTFARGLLNGAVYYCIIISYVRDNTECIIFVTATFNEVKVMLDLPISSKSLVSLYFVLFILCYLYYVLFVVVIFFY